MIWRMVSHYFCSVNPFSVSVHRFDIILISHESETSCELIPRSEYNWSTSITLKGFKVSTVISPFHKRPFFYCPPNKITDHYVKSMNTFNDSFFTQVHSVCYHSVSQCACLQQYKLGISYNSIFAKYTFT